MRALESNKMYLNVHGHEYTHGNVCATHLLRHCSRIAPSHAVHTLLQFINVVNFRLVNFRLRGSTLLWLKVTHSFSAGAPPWILLGELMTPPGFLISWRALFSFFPSRRLRHFVGTSVDENLSRTTSHFRGCTACNAKSNVHFTF